MQSELEKTNIYRFHSTAIARKKMSKPMRTILKELPEIMCPDNSILDYGCGRGDDVRFLRELGFNATGFDVQPFCIYKEKPVPADVVTSIYVLNVISDIEERRNLLTTMWNLAKKCLVVAVRTDKITGVTTPHKDGVLTSRSFQKQYLCNELAVFVAMTLGEKIPVTTLKSGVVYVERRDSR
jgi:DNA phosphorothioation-associated putative methyltransferase